MYGGGELSAVRCKVELVVFITVYNRGAEPQVSGGCIGLFIFFIEVECICHVRGGCIGVRVECAVQLSGRCIVESYV